MAEEEGDGDALISSLLPSAGAIAFFGFVVLLILGIAFYLWWGISYNGWLDNGVYAVTVTLVGFGLAGMLVTNPRPAPPQPSRNTP